MPPHESALTSGLLETLQESRIKLRDYANSRKKQIDDEVAQYNKILKEEQSDLDDKTKNLDKMKSERSSEEGIAQRRIDLDQDQKELEGKICNLKKEQDEQEQTLEHLREDERAMRLRAEETRDQKARVEESKQTTVDDLTQGIVNYKFLGFDFVKAKNNGLRFSFTHLDAGDKNRTFAFTLVANELDVYEVDDCALDFDVTAPFIQELNDTNDMSAFMLNMRREFSKIV